MNENDCIFTTTGTQRRPSKDYDVDTYLPGRSRLRSAITEHPLRSTRCQGSLGPGALMLERPFALHYAILTFTLISSIIRSRASFASRAHSVDLGLAEILLLMSLVSASSMPLATDRQNLAPNHFCASTNTLPLLSVPFSLRNAVCLLAEAI